MTKNNTNNTLIINGTGHRTDADKNWLALTPKQLTLGNTFMLAYNHGNSWWTNAYRGTMDNLWKMRMDDKYKNMVVISGLALGYDMLLVQCAVELNERLANIQKDTQALKDEGKKFNQAFLDITPITIVGAGITGQDGKWWEDHQKQYARVKQGLDYYYDTDILRNVEDLGWGARLNIRNEWMVDGYDPAMFGFHAEDNDVVDHIVLACYDGRPGGTTNCIRYALKKGVTVRIYDPLMGGVNYHDEYKLLRNGNKPVAPKAPKPSGAMFIKADLFSSTCDAVVNPVNCKGALGAGLAKQFKERTAHTTYEADYKAACKSGELKIGKPYVWKGTGKTIISLPTKNHWSSKSNLEDIRESLVDIFKNDGYGLKSIAIPALGCGLGGLEWSEVRELLEKFAVSMKNRKGVTIVIHEPSQQAEF